MRLSSICLLLAACGSTNVGGSYNGTLVITESNGNAVISATTNLNYDSGVELFSTQTGVDVECTLGGLASSGSTLHLDCATTTCSCSVSSNAGGGASSLEVTSASGTESNDVVMLQFSGTDSPANVAFSATFMGSLEPGTR
jgi:hypothetical protein